MFDPHVIALLPAAEAQIVKQALAALSQTTLFELQQTDLLNRLGQGAAGEEESRMLENLREFRRNTHALVALRELGKRYVVESEPEQE